MRPPPDRPGAQPTEEARHGPIDRRRPLEVGPGPRRPRRVDADGLPGRHRDRAGARRLVADGPVARAVHPRPGRWRSPCDRSPAGSSGAGSARARRASSARRSWRSSCWPPPAWSIGQASRVVRNSDRYVDQLSRSPRSLRPLEISEISRPSSPASRGSIPAMRRAGLDRRPNGRLGRAARTSDGTRRGIGGPAFGSFRSPYWSGKIRENAGSIGQWLFRGVGGVLGILGQVVVFLFLILYILYTRHTWADRIVRAGDGLGMTLRKDDLGRMGHIDRAVGRLRPDGRRRLRGDDRRGQPPARPAAMAALGPDDRPCWSWSPTSGPCRRDHAGDGRRGHRRRLVGPRRDAGDLRAPADARELRDPAPALRPGDRLRPALRAGRASSSSASSGARSASSRPCRPWS